MSEIRASESPLDMNNSPAPVDGVGETRAAWTELRTDETHRTAVLAYLAAFPDSDLAVKPTAPVAGDQWCDPTTGQHWIYMRPAVSAPGGMVER